MVLDYMMPGMTGLDVLRELRATPDLSDVPVVFYSADATGQASQAARQLGAKAWMTKGGMEWPELISTIDNVAADAVTS
jgi:two-component system chemotaxis response regulator CheY